MALDIRLDYIDKIDSDYIDKMSFIRKMFIEIDNMLKDLADGATTANNSAASRSVGLSRTFNEQACQCAIKSLCILGELQA